MNKNIGSSLPETMFALLLSSLILITLTDYYLKARQHYLIFQSKLNQAIETQTVMEFMRDSIRKAGFTPCTNLENLMTNHLVALKLEDNASSLLIYRMSEHFNSIFSIHDQRELLASQSSTIDPSLPIIVADCNHAEVQTVRQINHTPGYQYIYLVSPLKFSYQEPIYVGSFIQERFFMRQHKDAPSTLFYQMNRSDELSAYVHAQRLILKREGGRTQVEVQWSMEYGEMPPFKTCMRT